MAIRDVTQIPQPAPPAPDLPSQYPELPAKLAKAFPDFVEYHESSARLYRRIRESLATAQQSVALPLARIAKDATELQTVFRQEQILRQSADESLAAQIDTLILTGGDGAKTYLQTTAPASPQVGDRWIDTDDNFREYVWDGATWQDVTTAHLSGVVAGLSTETAARITADSAMATNITSLLSRMTTAEGNITATSGSLTSLTTTVTTLNGTVTAQGTAISTLQSQVQTPTTGLLARVTTIETTYATDSEVAAAQTTTLQAAKDYTDSQIIASSDGVVIYRQASAPTGTIVTGSLWFDSDDNNRLYRWDGAAWVETSDARILTLLSSVATIQTDYATKVYADGTAEARKTEAISASNTYTNSAVLGRNKVFRQSGTPTATAVGDVWYKTDDSNRPRVWDGAAWQVTDDSRIGTLQTSVATIQTDYATKVYADATAEARKNEAITTAAADATSKVNTEISARTTADNALSSRTSTLESQVQTGGTGLLARVSTIESAYATTSGVTAEISAAIATEVSARNSAISTAVSTETSARVAADGAIHAKWGVSINANGAVTGRVHLDGTGTTSEFLVDATAFTVWNGTAGVAPFQVIGGQVRVANLTIVSANISDRSLANIDASADTKLAGIAAGADVTLSAINGGLTITSGGLTLGGSGSIKSSNFVAGSTGWQIDGAGNGELNSLIIRDAIYVSTIATPGVSPASQSFTGSLSVTISGNGSNYVRYTTDGSDVKSTSTEWPGGLGAYTSLSVSTETVLRVACFTSAGKKSAEVVRNYTLATGVPLGSLGGGGSAASTGYTTIFSFPITCDGAQRKVSYSGGYVANASGAATTVWVALFRDTTMIAELGYGNGMYLQAGESVALELSGIDTPPAGARTFYVKVKSSAGTSVATGGTISL